MENQFKDLFKKYKNEAIENLVEWIKINSIYDETTVTDEKPFGEGVAKALDYIANLAEKNGFNVDRCDNYCTEISYGEGDLIAIYAHADVVPVSEGWEEEPFGAVIKDGKIYGRGTSDDKGPAMAAFYALKALKENNLINGYRVSLVIGGNEERGSKCLEHYFEVLKKPYPKYGFTPDGEFPLIYGEKGIANYKVNKQIKLPKVKSINAGLASNSVIDEANCILKNETNLEVVLNRYFNALSLRYEFETYEDGYGKLTVYGKAAHGSTPLLGINAGLCLLKFLGYYYGNTTLDKIATSYLDAVGEEMELFFSTPLLHGTTYNVGLINYEDGLLSYVVNFRYPENVNIEEVIARLNETEDLGVAELLSNSKPLLMDPNSEFIQTLLRVYQEETGDLESEIMTIGGGTYARESKNSVAFGSAFPGSADHIHDKNEIITLKDYLNSMPIYAHAIYELGRLK